MLYIGQISITGRLRQDGLTVSYFLQINIDCIDSPADLNPKGTSVTAEEKKRTSASTAKAYGYCIFEGLVRCALPFFLKKYLNKLYDPSSVCFSTKF